MIMTMAMIMIMIVMSTVGTKPKQLMNSIVRNLSASEVKKPFSLGEDDFPEVCIETLFF